jgi:hypothetical protein
MEALSPDSHMSHYRIVSRIGEGGMGEVFLGPVANMRPSGKRCLVRARAIYRRDRHVELAQVYRQLSAVVVPVVQHDRPQERYARNSEQFTFAFH